MDFRKWVAEQDASDRKKRRKVQAGYQKYFAGYTTYRVKRKNGRGSKVIRIYTDPFMEHELSDEDWKRQKLSFGILGFAAIAAYLFAALRDLPSNQWVGVSIFGSIGLAGMVFFGFYLVYYLIAPRKMTDWTQNRSHRFLMIFSLVTGLDLALTAILNLVFLLFLTSSRRGAELLNVLAYFVSAALLLWIWKRETDTTYGETENDTEIPDYEEMIL